MANRLEQKVVRNIKDAALFLFSRRSIPMLKGTLAYVLALVLIFCRSFDNLSQYPLALSSSMIVVIATGAGKSVGACIQATMLSIAGVSLGCVGFLVLAKLSPWPVAQAFVFALIVYVMALVKAQSPRWFGFSLLCILNSFNGIYTSYMLGSAFNPRYIEGYYIAYLWGSVIVLVVNLFVFPTSSEKELRQTLVTSLEHGYTLEINKEELAVREHLNQTIRADFGFLSQKIEETAVEVNYSRFSINSYQCFVTRTRALQQALITAHSSLVGVEEHDYDLFRERFLPSTLVAFNHLRRAVDLTIRDIGNELGPAPMVIPATQDRYNKYMSSMESQTPRDNMASQLALVAERLAAEIQTHTTPPSRSDTPDPFAPEGSGERHSLQGTSSMPSAAVPKNVGIRNMPKLEYGIQRLRTEFDAYATAQHDMLQRALVCGDLQGASDGELRVHWPRTSLRDKYGLDPVGNDAEGDMAPAPRAQHRATTSVEKAFQEEKGNGNGPDSPEGSSEKVLRSGQSLIRVWGFLFAMEQFVMELESLSSTVKPDGTPPKKKLHIHLFEVLRRSNPRPRGEREDELPLPEALALLEKRPYTPIQLNVWQRLGNWADIIQSPTSVFAAKTAAATSVFGILIYATAPRPWFVNYSLSAGMLTIVVALAPTLGQSMLAFILQIAGSGIGYLWSLAVLEMFRDVGGYTFNPYGITCMIIPFALIMEYLLYNVPKYFVVALLGLNGCGVVIITEWIQVEHLHRTNFDNPALRTGKALTALTVALAIVAIFQLFVLRNPARRTLRKQVANLTFDTLSYTVLLQAFGRSVLSADTQYRPSIPALLRVERELRNRELKLQSDIIDVMPLLSFASAEPQFATPFRKDIYLSFIRSNQLVLDRLREARAALGTQPFEDFILTNFVSVLAPYRARNTRAIKAELYMIASSLQSKAPLPHDTPMLVLTMNNRADFLHDTLVLSSRFAKTEQGNRSIRSREFMRYVSYLLGWTAVYEPIKAMEDASKELLGELESRLL